jgi:hypothetical protein
MDLNTALNVAINTASGTPPYWTACALCQLRGVDPHGQAMTMSVQNWQAVIMEQVLCAALFEMLVANR